MNPAEKVKDWFERGKQFYLDVRGEMKKVSWPSKQEVVCTTVVVVFAVLLFGAYLGIADAVWAKGLDGVLRYFSGAGSESS